MKNIKRVYGIVYGSQNSKYKERIKEKSIGPAFSIHYDSLKVKI